MTRTLKVPTWAQGEGWTFVQEEGEQDCADHLYACYVQELRQTKRDEDA